MATVLLVDDVKSEAQLMAKVVADAGHAVEFASDGEEAFAKAKQIKPDLIFLDVVMPKLDGFAACRRIKKDPETSSVPVVLVTSKSTDSDKFWGQRQGCDGYLTKPFTPDQLSAMLKKFLG